MGSFSRQILLGAHHCTDKLFLFAAARDPLLLQNNTMIGVGEKPRPFADFR
jgi:hypothetical protein